MAVIHIDGKTLEVDGSDNLLQACLSLGIDIPYFCYHPALGSVGSCRQCAVKQYMSEDDYKAGRGKLVMSCMIAPTNDMYISVDDTEAREFRKRIVEYLMTNHPHDCPTCEEGGHCHLQDMTYMSGHRARRYRFTKRTHHNQDLGVFINHEMNRCIACYRCVRFYKDYAGGTDFGVYASNNRVYFGREADGQFDSEFSGNLAEVCPTGVFTDKTHSDRYNRKWDMQYAPSICHGCSTGCNISAGERYGELRRIENRYNHDVNGYFLCDRGRFGYGYVNRPDRPTQPLEKVNGELIKVNADFALDGVVKLLQGKKLIGIGSPTASLESNFALKRLVGAERFSTGERVHTQALNAQAIALIRHGDVHQVSLSQIESADAVFILGEDLTQIAPRVALSVRQAAKNKARQMATALRTEHWLAEPVKRIGQDNYSPIYVTGVVSSKLDDIAKVSAIATPNDIARLGFMVGDIIHSFAETLDDISDAEQALFAKESDIAQMDDEAGMASLAHHIAYDLIMADRPLLIAGTSLASDAIIRATGYIAQALSAKRAKIKHVTRVCLQTQSAHNQANADAPSHDPDKLSRPENDGTDSNVAMEAQMTRRPIQDAHADAPEYLAQAGVYVALPEANSAGLAMLGGLGLEEVLALEADALVVLENDLSQQLSQSALDALKNKTLIVVDHQRYDWHEGADFILSSGSFAESDGTLVSAEGRAQRFFAAYDKKYYAPNSDIKDAWRWLGAVSCELNPSFDQWENLEDVIEALCADVPALQGIKGAAPMADYRITGLKVAREPRRYSGRTAMRAKLSIHEPMQPKDTDTALTFSMEGYVGDKTSPAMIPFAWSAGWNSPQAWNKLQEKVGGKLKGGDVGVRLFDELPKLTHVFEKQQLNDAPATSIFEGRAKLVPVYQLFSSAPLVASSPVVASQIVPAVWLVGHEDAARWQLQAGEILSLSQGDEIISLPVALTDCLAEGCVGYPAGQVPLLPQLPTSIKKDETAPVFVPAYKKRIQALATLTASPRSTFNLGKQVQQTAEMG